MAQAIKVIPITRAETPVQTTAVEAISAKRSALSAFMYGKRRRWAYKSLRRNLARIVETAKNHEASGLAAGDKIYRNLHTEAEQICNSFCKDWSVDRARMETDHPSLRKLRLAAHPAAATASPQAALVIGGGLLFLLSPLLLGIWTELYTVGQHFVAHLRLFGG